MVFILAPVSCLTGWVLTRVLWVICQTGGQIIYLLSLPENKLTRFLGGVFCMSLFTQTFSSLVLSCTRWLDPSHLDILAKKRLRFYIVQTFYL